MKTIRFTDGAESFVKIGRREVRVTEERRVRRHENVPPDLKKIERQIFGKFGSRICNEQD